MSVCRNTALVDVIVSIMSWPQVRKVLVGLIEMCNPERGFIREDVWAG